METVKSYKSLIAWQKSVELVTLVYSITKSFPAEERFGIVSQLNRAVISIPANIAEGWGRESRKNYLQFLRNSRGSLMEVETLLIISKNLNFINENRFQEVEACMNELSKILIGLIKSIQRKIELSVNS